MDELKNKAKEQGLWNLFVPPGHAEFCDHDGLSNLDYAPLAEIMGRVLWSPEVFNCNAPDTGNMEVFMKYGTAAQQAQWLTPLLNGDIRSSYAMTEPQVASSDATNIELSIAREGDEWVLNGRKWFITGAMYERCKIFIVMGKSDPDNPSRHKQQTQVLVPRDTPGLELVRPLTTLGYDDAPCGTGIQQCPGTAGKRITGRRTGLRDRPGAPGSGAHPSLHAFNRRGPAITGTGLSARQPKDDIWPHPQPAPVSARGHRQMLLGNRNGSPAGTENLPENG
jgi:alkylation response protein AidB-like acyl-CoA dehydrogenase